MWGSPSRPPTAAGRWNSLQGGPVPAASLTRSCITTPSRRRSSRSCRTSPRSSPPATGWGRQVTTLPGPRAPARDWAAAARTRDTLSTLGVCRSWQNGKSGMFWRHEGYSQRDVVTMRDQRARRVENPSSSQQYWSENRPPNPCLVCREVSHRRVRDWLTSRDLHDP